MKGLRLVVTSSRISLKEDTDLPEWYTIFPDGVVELHDEDSYLVDAEAWKEFQKFLSSRQVDIPWDWNHASIITGAEALAYGWSGWAETEWRYIEGVGIQARVQWLDATIEQLNKGQVRYHSPVFFTRKSDKRLVAIHSIALTNTPKHNKLQELIDRGDVDELAASLYDFKRGIINMDLAELVALLGLPEGSTEQDVTEAIKALQADAGNQDEVPAAVTAALGITESDVSTVVASVHALKQGAENGVSQADFQALKLQMAEKEATEVVRAAIEVSCKVIPAQKEWALKYATSDLSGFRKFVEKAPVVGVPVGRLPNPPKEEDTLELSAASIKIAGLMGNDLKDVKKYNGKGGSE